MDALSTIKKKINRFQEKIMLRASISNLFISIFIFLMAFLGPIIIFLLFTIYSIIYGVVNLPRYINFNKLIKKAKNDKVQGLKSLLDESYLDKKASDLIRRDILKIYAPKRYISLIISNFIETFLFINFQTIESVLSEKLLGKIKDQDFQPLEYIKKDYLNSSLCKPKIAVNSIRILTKEELTFFSKSILKSLKNNDQIRYTEVLFQRYYGSQIWNFQLVESLKQDIQFNMDGANMDLISGNFDNVSISEFCIQSLKLFQAIEFNLENQTFLSKLHPSLRTQDQFKNLEDTFKTYLETKNLAVFYYQIKIKEMEQHCIFYRIYQQWF